MRRLLAPLILLLIVAFASCTSKPKSPGDGVSTICIKYTELGRQTIFRITCNNFDTYFPKPMTINVISKQGIDSLMTVLDNMKSIDNSNQPDVRSKIYINHIDHKVDTVCIGVSVVKYKQGTYETPQKLLMMIQQ